jgi:hypothetical protein
MKYNFNDKVINIPDAEIQANMKHLELTEAEAIQVWLEDNEYIENEEQNALCKKAKDNRITATVHQAREKTERKPVERERKQNPTKELIIAAVAKILPELGAVNINIENIGKIITFSLENEEFKLDLVQKRKKKA